MKNSDINDKLLKDLGLFNDSNFNISLKTIKKFNSLKHLLDYNSNDEFFANKLCIALKNCKSTESLNALKSLSRDVDNLVDTINNACDILIELNEKEKE